MVVPAARCPRGSRAVARTLPGVREWGRCQHEPVVESKIERVRPDLSADPVGAVLDAHLAGALLELATSGTSADARVVVRSTESWWSLFGAYSELSGVGDGARVWVPGPLRGTMNLFAAVHARWAGAVLVDDPVVATHACLTPALLDRRGTDLPAGTVVTVAGAVLPVALAEQAWARGLRTAHYYGAAELSFVAAGTCGADLRAFPGVEIEVRGGEIWVRSEYLCDGYVGPTGSLRRDEEGWATVGDTGVLVDGVLTVHGRPDTVITAGVTVAIAEVEAELLPAARSSFAVFGVPHPAMGELLAVAVTDESDRAALERYARERLPASHRPRRWYVVDALPLTDAGKLDRARLVRVLADA